jgi:hypothetical protein
MVLKYLVNISPPRRKRSSLSDSGRKFLIIRASAIAGPVGPALVVQCASSHFSKSSPFGTFHSSMVFLSDGGKTPVQGSRMAL